MTTAGSLSATNASTERMLTRLVQVMPHASFAAGPYKRGAQVVAKAADDDLRFKAQLQPTTTPTTW